MSERNEIRVLASAGADRAVWLEAWRACGREPFAHPDYVTLFASDAEEAICITLTSSAGVAILPLILRPMGRLSWAGGTTCMDATSPYGYGGPYASDDVEIGDLWAVVSEWMTEHSVVSSFVRLALDAPMSSVLPYGTSLKSGAMNVIVDLGRSEEDQWRHYEHKVRKNVNKANRAGLSVELKESFTDLEEFFSLYSSTMDRRGASAWYYFDLEFFSTLTKTMRGSWVAAEVRDDCGRLVSAELILQSDRYLYSFLGGTLREAFPHAPNDLLKHAVIGYGRESGRSGYVLGGGYTVDDGIFRYKRAFDPTGCVPFSRMELVSDEAAYARLIEQRLAFVRRAQPDAQLPESFFPRYRGTVTSGTEAATQ